MKFLIVVLISILAISGCKTVEYYDGERKMVPMDLDGVHGWFVPDAMMIDIYKKLKNEK